jgi:hypothetical protein
MLLIAIPTSDLSQLPQGVPVRINGESVVIRKAGEYLLWNDQRRLILDVQPCVVDNGIKCISFTAE